MIVPKYWAEGRIQSREGGKQLTVRRFGWSDANPQDAQAHADVRTLEAFKKIQAGEKQDRQEPKVKYNGAEGVPIREEILSSHGNVVITRNSYGAHCLNTPDVLFADIDFDGDAQFPQGILLTLVLVGIAAFAGFTAGSIMIGIVGIIGAFTFSRLLYMGCRSILVRIWGGAEKIARKKILRFGDSHPDWHLRLYKTPAGIRILVMHRTFDPTDPVVAAFFKDLGTDPLFAKMCIRQRCFRARVSPKPWRIGIGAHMRPHPGVWPVHPDRLPVRNRWIQEYEAKAKGYAACRFVEALGSRTVVPAAEAVRALHDERSGAGSQRPLA